MTAVIKYSDARRVLAHCTSTDEAKKWVAKADAMVRYAKHQGEEGKALKIEAERIMWLAKDRLGVILKQMAERGERATKGSSNQYVQSSKTELSNLGISKKLSSEAQRVADLPAKVKEEALASDNPSKAMRENLKKHRKAPTPHPKRDEIVALADARVPLKDIAVKTDTSPHTARREIEREAIKREAEAQIDPTTLSLTAQQRLAAVLKQYKHKLDIEYDTRVRDGVKESVESLLPIYHKRLAEADRILKSRRGILPRAMFRKILASLHPDRGGTTEVFNAFKGLEQILVGEKELPTPPTNLPRTYEEMMQRKRDVSAARRARRNGTSVAV